MTLDLKILAILVISCPSLLGSRSLGQKAKYDFDKSTNFAQFKTYRWVKIKGAEQMEEPLDQEIRAALDAGLRRKGLSKVDDDKADLCVAYQTAVSKEENVMSYSLHGAETLGDAIVYVGQLVVDFYDGATEKLVWRAAVTKTIQPNAKPEKRQKNLDKSVSRLLKNYPPKTTAWLFPHRSNSTLSAALLREPG